MKNWYEQACAKIDGDIRQQALQRQLQLTKPPGSLGRLEDIATQLSAMQATLNPQISNLEITVFAADHGVAEEGVSAFPQVVTIEMIKNFVCGGAAISVLAKRLGARLRVVNAGTNTAEAFSPPVINRPVACGTRNFTTQPAMSMDQCNQALQLGHDMISELNADTHLVIGGEMGIANTTSASALAVAYGIGEADILVGPGTGLDQAGINHKVSVIRTGLSRVGNADSDLSILAELGGFEIAALCGYFIHAAQRGFPILVDGFITSVAAFIACRINPSVRDWMMFAHSSKEPGHRYVLQAMQAEPILSLDMCLGEGSGAAVAVNLLQSACTLQNEMATFSEAGVSTE